MGRKSSITRLDPRVREAVDAAVRDGRATIDEIVALIGELGGEASRTAVGRYIQRANEQMQKYREAQEVAKVWLRKLESEPEGDVARLLPELLRLISYRTMDQMSESDKPTKAMDIMLLGKAMDHLAKAEKAGVEKTLRIRKEVAAKAAEAAKNVARKGGISDDVIRKIEEGVLGIVR